MKKKAKWKVEEPQWVLKNVIIEGTVFEVPLFMINQLKYLIDNNDLKTYKRLLKKVRKGCPVICLVNYELNLPC